MIVYSCSLSYRVEAVRKPPPEYNPDRSGCVWDLLVTAGLMGSGVRRSRALVDSRGRAKEDFSKSKSTSAGKGSWFYSHMSTFACL